jgi:hypothetical protein
MDEAANSTPRPAVLLVGTGHWANPGLDMLSPRYDDMLSERRQREIAECIQRLLRFRPTRVAVEVLYERQTVFDERYAQYREGKFELTANEVYQLGFRIAAEAGHERVYTIDWQDDLDWEGVFAYAEQHNQSRGINEGMALIKREIDDFNERVPDMTVLEMLGSDNDPVRLESGQQLYLELARVGEGDRYLGADLIAGWYGRNLKMFANITRIPTSADDRILVVVGAGHVPLLDHFLRSSRRYFVESVYNYIGE